MASYYQRRIASIAEFRYAYFHTGCGYGPHSYHDGAAANSAGYGLGHL